MSSLLEIKSEVASLSEDDRARLREWFSEKDSRERDEETGRNPSLLTMSDFILMEQCERRLEEILDPEN